MRLLAVILGTLLALIAVAYGAASLVTDRAFNKIHELPAHSITIPADTAAIARGNHLTHAVSVCVDCHGTKFEGGVVFESGPIGRIVAPNLTRGKGGVGGELTDDQFVAAIRYGVMPNGHSARVMPSDEYSKLSDADLGAVIAYIHSLPPVDREPPAMVMGPLGKILFAAGQLPFLTADRVDRASIHAQAPPAGVTREYGDYMTNIGGCTGCHGPHLSGGQVIGAPPDFPKAANLTPSGELAKWTQEDFLKMMRTGVAPGGRNIPASMPWIFYKDMSNMELQAIWEFVKSVPARPAGTQ